MDSYEVAIVGGGPAGLAAALLAGRACLHVLMIDGGEPRNARTHAAHSFLTRDGIPPLELRRIAVEQLAPYDVTIQAPHTISGVSGANGNFVLTRDDGVAVNARKLVLATGVRDVLPEVSGVAEGFGRGVFHCPYCDGWEVRNRPLALMLPEARVAEAIPHFRSWSRDLTMVPAPGGEWSTDSLQLAGNLDVKVRATPVRRVIAADGGVTIEFDDDTALDVAALFVQPRQAPRNELARQLGCDVVEEDGPIPGLVMVDAFGRTNVPGVFAAGDLVTGMQQVWIASTAGGIASLMAHRELVEGGFPFD